VTQRGFTLIETMIATAVVAIAIGGLVLAMAGFGRFSTHQAGPVRSAAMQLAEQTLRVAQDAWKYGSPGNAPSGSWQTAVPLAIPGSGATTAPVTVTASIANMTAQSAQLTVTVQYTPDANHADDPGSVSLSGQTEVKAPVPGATVLEPALIPQPSGAP
jgi:prepilin-type N-terminal cleavage/methylation domain-containing protein